MRAPNVSIVPLGYKTSASSVSDGERKEIAATIGHLMDLRVVIVEVQLQHFDGNLPTVKGAFVHVTKTPRGNLLVAGVKEMTRNYVRFREYPLSTRYPA